MTNTITEPIDGIDSAYCIVCRKASAYYGNGVTIHGRHATCQK